MRGRAFLPGKFRRPGGAESLRNTRRGGEGVGETRAPAGGAESPRDQAPNRAPGDERMRRPLCESASRPICRIQRDIDNAGLWRRPARRGRSQVREAGGPSSAIQGIWNFSGEFVSATRKPICYVCVRFPKETHPAPLSHNEFFFKSETRLRSRCAILRRMALPPG